MLLNVEKCLQIWLVKMFYNYTEQFNIKNINDFLPNTLMSRLFMLDEVLKIRGCSSRVILSSGIVHSLLFLNKTIDPLNKENIYSFYDFWNKDLDFFLLPEIEENVLKYKDFSLFQFKNFDFLNPKYLFKHDDGMVFITESSYRECVLDIDKSIVYTTKNYLKSVESDKMFPPSWYDGTIQSMRIFLKNKFEEPLTCLCRASIPNKGKVTDEIIPYLNHLMEYTKESLPGDLFYKYMTRFTLPPGVADFINQNDFSDLWKNLVQDIVVLGDPFSWERKKLEEAYRNEARVGLLNYIELKE